MTVAQPPKPAVAPLRRARVPLPQMRRKVAEPSMFGAYMMLAPLLGVTLFAKIGIPPLAARGIGISIFLLLMGLVYGIGSKRLVISLARLTSICLIFGSLGILHLLIPDFEVKLSSLGLLFFLFLPFALEGSDSTKPSIDVEKFVVSLALFFAVCGLYQFVAQKVMPLVAIKPIDLLIPQSLQVQGFNAFATEGYKSERFRPNGIFFLEPSFYSQFLALGIVIQTFAKRMRPAALAIMFLGLVTSLSGTGIIVLIVGMVPLVALGRGRAAIIFLLVLLVVFVMFHDELGLQRTWERMMEFDRPGTSSHERFVAGFGLLGSAFDIHPEKLWFGYGPGQLSREVRIEYGSSDMAIVKLTYEYGVVGTLMLLSFMASIIYRGSRSLPITLASMTLLLMNGALIPFFYGIVLPLAVWRRRSPQTQEVADPAPPPVVARKLSRI
ncbi:MAG: hypothetical protein JWQ11_2959 [Rhizobacter sp.]|nr:hypothetical protein [Rhizobacter sp.]